jgi:signal transduction histidine kinase
MPEKYQELWAQCELRNRQLEEKNRQIEALLDSSPAGILVISRDRRVLRANSQARRMLAVAGTSLDGAATDDVIADLSARLGPSASTQVLAAALQGCPTQAEVSFTSPESRTVWIQQTAVRDSAGEPLGALVLLQDISEIVRMRWELEDLAQLPATNPFPVVRLRLDGRFTYANPACRAFLEELGLSDNNIESLLPPDYRSLLQRILETREPVADVKVETLGRTLQLTFGPFIARDEVFLMIVDISEKQRAEALLKKHAQELEEAYTELRRTQAQLVQSEKMAMLGALAAGIAHEVNTPLGAISSNADTQALAVRRMTAMLEKALSRIEPTDLEEAVRMLQVIRETAGATGLACDRISRIVRSLKSFARLDEAPIKSVDLHEGLEGALTLLHNQLKKRIEVVREYGALPPVECVPSEINQVFMNLLVNAIEAIPEKGVIRVRTEKEGGTVRISINDSGRGIPREKLDRLFEPSFTTQRGRIGAGLGLPISYKIVQDHHGQILVESGPGLGSTFTVVLPVTFAGRVRESE